MQIYTTCPACSDSRTKSNDKCLSTNTETGVYLCHHCGCTGVKHGQKQDNVERKQKTSGIASKPPTKAATGNFKLPDKPLPDTVIEFFNNRGISENVLERNNIEFNGREILFPYFRDGQIVNIKYRTLDKKFRQEAGAAKIFYGLDDIKDSETAIIVEGEFDKLALEEAGYTNVLSVPDGAPATNTKSYASKFSYIENCEKQLEGVKKFILAVDNDAPGKKLEEELARRLSPEKCWTVSWTDGCKDANAVLIKHGKEELRKVINQAKPIPISGLFTVKDFSDALLDLYDDGHQGGDSTGWFNLDPYYTARPGEVSVVTGIPSHGKSEFIDALMINLANDFDWRFAVFSPENYPTQSHIAKLCQKYIGKPFSKGFNGHMTKEELLESEHWLSEHFMFIAPHDDELTVDHIIGKAKMAVMRFGIKGMIIDPWNEIDHSRPSGKTETEYISECLTKIRRFARMYKVHVWLIAHPAKLYKQNGIYPVPTPYDISGSAHFRNKADNCLCVWRDLLDESRAVEIHVQKIRFREVGKIGKVNLQYDIFSGRYEDVQSTI